tara:strand:- start:3689 stop:4180 length:492 start_codon:yes stop_codon:yes gene_type:complete
MALKADRYELQTDISFFCDEVTTRGGIVHLSGGGSGAAMDQGVNKVVTKALPVNADVPMGILLNDVVNKDLTRTHLNQYKDEVQKGGKVTVLRKGYVVTDKISGTPTAGQWALASSAGTISGISDLNNHSLVDVYQSGVNMVVGKFLSVKDSDGYCKVEINLP